MPLDSGVVVSHSGALAAGRSLVNARTAEASESVEHAEPPFHRGPARGILIGVMIGAGAWGIIFAAVASARAIFFG
jgi:hypothetical protein